MYMDHCILLFCLSHRSSSVSSVHLIDNFVWQYNVEPTRATSEALDGS
jgi:hypothetical protein